MSADDKPCQATLSVDLRQQIMDSRVPKNEREWWASRMIEKLERELAAERAKVRVLRDACESICEEWGRNHDTNPIGAGQKMETLASKALEKLEDEA